jgi:hypothetical protein
MYLILIANQTNKTNISRLQYLCFYLQRINILKQQLADHGDNKRKFPAVPLDGTIDNIKGMMLDNKYLYERCREDGLTPRSLIQLKISQSSNNGNYSQKSFCLVNFDTQKRK